MAAEGSPLRLNHQVEHDGLLGGVFPARVFERGHREVRREGWATSARELPSLGKPLFRTSHDGGESLVGEADDVLLEISLFSGRVWLEAAASSAEAIDALVGRLREKLPAQDPSSAHELTVTF